MLHIRLLAMLYDLLPLAALWMATSAVMLLLRGGERVAPGSAAAMIEFLLQQFQLEEQDLYHTDGPVNLYRLREVLTEIDRPDLKYPAFTPSVPAALEVGDDDLFQTIARQDILLHHPFQSFAPVLDFIRASATDPKVVAIKQTVYRTGATSELMQILIDAARAGKEVTVKTRSLAGVSTSLPFSVMRASPALLRRTELLIGTGASLTAVTARVSVAAALTFRPSEAR